MNDQTVKTENSKANDKTTKIELELNEEELKIIDDYLDNEGFEVDDKTNYRPGAINSIIINSQLVHKLFEVHSEYSLHYNEYDEKLHNEIKQYQDHIKQYQCYIDKLYNDIKQYQGHITKLHNDIGQYCIEIGKNNDEI